VVTELEVELASDYSFLLMQSLSGTPPWASAESSPQPTEPTSSVPTATVETAIGLAGPASA
jgi:hypothetical protein